jgi:serine/threonine protein kinase
MKKRHSNHFLDPNRRYRAMANIGDDALGDLWAAEDTVLGTRVIIRILAQTLRRDRRLVEDLAAVVQELLRPVVVDSTVRPRLSHPNAARVIAFERGDEATPTFMVMQSPSGVTLAERIRTMHSLDVVSTAHIGSCIAGALHAAHEEGDVHGGVHPGGILTNQVMVLDFGLVTAICGRPPPRVLPTEILDYMAPELRTQGSPTPQSDVYALGALLVTMLATRDATTGNGEEASRSRPEEAPWPPDAAASRLRAFREGSNGLRLRGDIPEELIHVCDLALLADQWARPSAGDLLAALTSIAAGASRETHVRPRIDQPSTQEQQAAVWPTSVGPHEDGEDRRGPPAKASRSPAEPSSPQTEGPPLPG